ncbi:hypothetical protein [uncultured Draconibacterium sp.]
MACRTAAASKKIAWLVCCTIARKPKMLRNIITGIDLSKHLL